jgi:3-oxoacyl-[acyl-carrier-protein] synthase II
MTDPVVITGAGVVCSLGIGQDAVWDALLSGKSGVRSIAGFDARGFRCAAAQVVDLNKDESGIDPRDTRIMRTHSYMLSKATRDAFTNAGLPSPSLPSEAIGFFAGMGMVDYEVNDLLPAVLKSLNPDRSIDYDTFFSEGFQEIHPLWPLSMLNNVSFCLVAIGLDIQGDNTVFSPHADSGGLSVREAMLSVRERRSGIAFAAGVSETISPLSLARMSLAGLLASGDRNDEQLPRPFDAERTGTVLGEGCGVVSLELLSSARARGAEPLAELSGVGAACEHRDGATSPTATAIAAAMEQALRSAGMIPQQIDAVIAHGDGSREGDAREIEALQTVFSGEIGRLPVFSSKGSLGHLLAAAPVVDLITGISMLTHNTVPATLHTRRPDTSVHFNLVLGSALHAPLHRILINCRSAEGQAVSLIIEKSLR